MSVYITSHVLLWIMVTTLTILAVLLVVALRTIWKAMRVLHVEVEDHHERLQKLEGR